MAAILGILDSIGTALNPAFGGGGDGGPGRSLVNDLGLGFFAPGGGYGTGPGGTEILPADAVQPLNEAFSYALWIALAFLAAGVMFAGGQMAWARHHGQPNPGAQRLVVIIIVCALLGSLGSLAGMIIT